MTATAAQVKMLTDPTGAIIPQYFDPVAGVWVVAAQPITAVPVPETISSFVAGTTTVVTLTGLYRGILVNFDGVFQGPDTYTLVGHTLTFNAAIPLGTTKVYILGWI